MVLRIKDWHKFQHFRDRKPPWIKLYRDLLDDVEWHDLDPKAAKALVMIWLIASENDGELPDFRALSFRLRVSENEIKSIISKLYHWLIQDDINAISVRYQDDIPEKETETEIEREKDNSSKQVRTQYGEGFEVFWGKYPKDANMSKKEAHIAWKRLGKEEQELAVRGLDGFTAYCRANPDYRPVHAVRYLKNARWEGFLTPSGGNGSVTPHHKHISEMTDEERAAFLQDFWSQRETRQ